jgi:hypothetical protein
VVPIDARARIYGPLPAVQELKEKLRGRTQGKNKELRRVVRAAAIQV